MSKYFLHKFSLFSYDHLVVQFRSNQISLESLGASFHRGEVQAFGELHRRFRNPIFQFLGSRLASRQSAEEVCQEVFLKAYRFRKSYDPRYSISTWIWTITRNTLIDWQRKNGEHRTGTARNGQYVLEEDLAICEDPSAEEILSRKDEKQRLRRVLRKLPVLQRRVMFLRYLKRMPYIDIARRLGVSLSAAKCAGYRARLSLGT